MKVIKTQVLSLHLLVTFKSAILLSLTGFYSDLRVPFTLDFEDEKSISARQSAIMYKMYHKDCEVHHIALSVGFVRLFRL